MQYLFAGLGIFVTIAIAYMASNDRKKVRFRPIFIMLAIQFVLAYCLFNTKAGISFINYFVSLFQLLIAYAMDGINFVIGPLDTSSHLPFFISVLLPIVFLSALIGIFQYIGVLQFIIKYTGLVISKVNGMGKLESYNAIAAFALGQSEVFISIKNDLDYLTKQRLYTMATSAMSTVSMSIVAAYMRMIDPACVVVALPLNLFGGFIIASLINPYKLTEEEDDLKITRIKDQSFFEMLFEYIMDGFKIAVIVGAMLLGFVSILALINGVFAFIFGITFQNMLGYLFSPLAILMGIDYSDAISAGSIMATKLVSNEFVAMLDLQAQSGMSERTVKILSVFLVSFANFSSIGSIAGSVKALNERQGNVMMSFALKLVFGASLVSIISGAVASFFI